MITGCIASIIAGLLPLNVIVEFLSIGTLMSFMVVSIGVVYLRKAMPDIERKV